MYVECFASFTVRQAAGFFKNPTNEDELINLLLEVQARVIKDNGLSVPVGCSWDHIHGYIDWTFEDEASARRFEAYAAQVQNAHSVLLRDDDDHP